MATITNPKIHLHPEAINVDAKIQELQLAFAEELQWLTKAFGRSFKQYRKDDKGKNYTFPAVYAGKKEYFNCFPNDTLAAYCFFEHRDKAKPSTELSKIKETYQPGTWNEWQHEVDIIFWFNQKKVAPGKDYIITENLLAEVRKVLRDFPFFTPTGVFYKPENIFDGYTLNIVEEQFLSFPYGGFRIEGEIQFLEQDNFGQC